MKQSPFAIALLLLVLPAVADEKVDLDTIHRIRTEAFQNSQVMEHLFYLTEVHGPRLTGSPALRKASEWTVERLKEFGASKAELEPWGPFGRGWAYSRFRAELIEPQYAPLIGFPLAWTPGTDGAVSGELVYAPIEKEEDFEQYKGKLKNKIILISKPHAVALETAAPAHRWSESELENLSQAVVPNPKDAFRLPEPENRPNRPGRSQRRNKINKFLVDEGVLLRIASGQGSPNSPSHRSQNGTVFATSGGSRDKDATDGPSTIALTPEHYNRLARLLAKKIPLKVEVDVQAEFHDEDLDSFNVIGEIKGHSKHGEFVMLGGHLDSWHGGTGATDNAAGCSVALEAFRILKALDLQMDRTVRLALWTGEEQGLLGSKAYVKKHFADPDTMDTKPEHATLCAYFNLDNGSGKIRGVYLQQNDMLRPVFRAWLEPFHDLGATTLGIRNTSGTDHLPFNAVGLPGFQFIQDRLEYSTRTHHSNMDLYDKVQAKDLMQASAIMASFVYHAATRPEILPRKPLPEPRVKPGEKKEEQGDQ